MTQLLTYPARPVNGGHLDFALPKIGDWSYEPKYNDWRTLIHVPTRGMWNRHGQPSTIARYFGEALHTLCDTLNAEAWDWVDCGALERRHEMSQGTLIVFDVVPAIQFSNETYTERRRWLETTLSIAPLDPKLILPDSVYLAPNNLQPVTAWQELQNLNTQVGCDYYEGLVAKRRDSPYPVQINSSEQTTPTWMKHRFIK
jgi:ATP-dependent DNA ligase